MTPPPSPPDLARLAALLRRGHLYVEDCWYSCPLAEDGCCDDQVPNDQCRCGADEHNANLDALLAHVAALTGERDHAVNAHLTCRDAVRDTLREQRDALQARLAAVEREREDWKHLAAQPGVEHSCQHGTTCVYSPTPEPATGAAVERAARSLYADEEPAYRHRWATLDDDDKKPWLARAAKALRAAQATP